MMEMVLGAVKVGFYGAAIVVALRFLFISRSATHKSVDKAAQEGVRLLRETHARITGPDGVARVVTALGEANVQVHDSTMVLLQRLQDTMVKLDAIHHHHETHRRFLNEMLVETLRIRAAVDGVRAGDTSLGELRTLPRRVDELARRLTLECAKAPPIVRMHGFIAPEPHAAEPDAPVRN